MKIRSLLANPPSESRRFHSRFAAILLTCLIAVAMGSTSADDSKLQPEKQAELARLIERLGSDSPSERMDAEERLQAFGKDAADSLFDAILSADLERVRRARRLLTRLEGGAFPVLSREAKSENARRAAQAKLLLAGLTNRLVDQKLSSLLERLDAAVEEKRVTATEHRNWRSQITRNQLRLEVDEQGNVLESALEKQLACREALPADAIDGKSSLTTEELAEFREGGPLPKSSFQGVWNAFAKTNGSSPETRKLFSDMLVAESALLETAARILEDDSPEAERAELDKQRRILGGLHDLRTQDFVATFRDSMKGIRLVPGKPFPNVYDDATLGRLAAFLFVRSELSETLPTDTLSSIMVVLTTGLRGYQKQQQPLYEMVKDPQDDRAKAIRRLMESSTLTSKTGASLEVGLNLAMQYRLADASRQLAQRVLDDVEESYVNDYRKNYTRLMAVHALHLFGNSPEEARLASRLLEDSTQIRLTSYRKEEKRRYIEIREMGAMAALKLLGKKPEDIGGANKVTGYCPVKGLTQFDAIMDGERWGEIKSRIATWISRPADEKEVAGKSESDNPPGK